MFWRVCYSLLGALLLPLLFVRLWWRGRKNPGYRKNIGERFGCYATTPLRNTIWIHAVSVGETRAAAPLIALLEQRYPESPIVLTHMTATGRATGETLFGNRITQFWLPYDYRFAVRAFFDHVQPKWALLMETEIWPNAITECARRRLPCFLVNARMSERSAARYARLASFTRPLFAMLTGIAAQTEDDAQRFRELGARDVTVTGNLKFDINVPENARSLGAVLRQRFCQKPGQRPVWIAASTRASANSSEEALLLDALQRQPDALPPRTLTVIVPRHPERFENVAAQLRARNLAFVKRSDEADVPPEVSFVLGDSMGEMFAYYAAADLAFVGGSLLPLGGQNLLEPLAMGASALIGSHTFNFKDISAAACAAGAVMRVSDADELIVRAGALLRSDETRNAMRDAGLRFLQEHRGAAERLAQWLGRYGAGISKKNNP
ncbi:MAG: lipid IV(A) 3-deoxy-D-manno-octulosonic acid transferase [Burkholderiales bacterium]|jgi:3-deoxy-D-manno-octulosonic-acid transferase|nr:lipid IV(A) 3-deoxy-D-manno-octulosonic acid transferase [Burkholderiales bacterium]